MKPYGGKGAGRCLCCTLHRKFEFGMRKGSKTVARNISAIVEESLEGDEHRCGEHLRGERACRDPYCSCGKGGTE